MQGAGVGGRFDLKKKTGEWMCSFDTDAWILSKIFMPAARNVIFFICNDWILLTLCEYTRNISKSNTGLIVNTGYNTMI